MAWSFRAFAALVEDLRSVSKAHERCLTTFVNLGPGDPPASAHIYHTPTHHNTHNKNKNEYFEK